MVFLYSYLVMVNMSFNENNFVLISAKFTYQNLFQGISDATNMVIYYAVTIEKSEKKNQFHAFTCNVFRPFKMVNRNTFLWKKEKNYKDMNFAQKESSC